MTPFHLKIVTPDGLIYDGQAEEMLVRRCANRGSLSAIAYGNPVVCCVDIRI